MDREITAQLGGAKSKYGFYMVLGNHDGWYSEERVYCREDLMTGNSEISKALSRTKPPVSLKLF